MATKIQLRRDTAANWETTNAVLSQGELGLDLTYNRIKVGDGIKFEHHQHMMQWICMVNAETLSLYNECPHYLLGLARKSGLILIIAQDQSTQAVDPTW